MPSVGDLNNSYSYEAVVVWKGKVIEDRDLVILACVSCVVYAFRMSPQFFFDDFILLL